MTRATLLLALLLLAGVAGAAEPEALVRVSTVVSSGRVLAGQPFTARVVVLYDVERMERHAAPLFRREMDLQLQLRVPWAEPIAGLAPAPGSPLAADGPTRSVAVGDDVAPMAYRGTTKVDGRDFAMLTLERAFVASEAGTIELPAASLRYAYATRFEDDFVGGRVALDPRDVVVAGSPVTVRVQPLPTEDRPAAFRDAIGRFTLGASLPEDRPVDGVLRVRLRIAGEGNLSTLEVPMAEAFPGFHLLGTTDDQDPRARTVVYELRPLRADVTEIPAITLATLDPGPPPAWRTLRTEPIPIPGARAPAVPERPAAEREPPVEGPTLHLVPAALALAVLVLLLWIASRLWRRRAAPHGTAPGPAARAAETAAALRAGLAGSPDQVFGLLVAFLAARLDCGPGAIIDPALRARLEARGVPPGTAREVATAIERHVAAAYGGPPAPAPLVDARAIDRLEEALRPVVQGGER